ncbi:MAG: amidohydrolase family protein [candidate division Zixibacteria bacterium]|nr:amidohydrolase family protein [candidate division Zixibacteria bacterium]
MLDVKEGVLRENLDILIEDQIIKEVGKLYFADKENVKTIDCSGKFALPGLFECHSHLSVLTNQPEKDREEILEECGIAGGSLSEVLEKQVLKKFVEKGITQVRDCGGPIETLRGLKDKISSREYMGPELFYSGPVLEKSPLRAEQMNQRWPGWSVAVDTLQDAENIIQQISKEDAALVKTFSKFDFDVLKHLLDKTREFNLPVTHDPGPTFFHSIPVDVAIDLGIRCIEHGKSPWYIVLKDGLKSEHDKLFDSSPENKEAFINRMFDLGVDSISATKLKSLGNRMLENQVYFCPTLHVFKRYSEHPEEFNPDELDKFRKRFEILLKIGGVITKEFIRQGIKILVGQDGYNPLFTFDEMQLLKELDLSEWEIIKGATLHPAQWLGVDHKFGSVSPGKSANILILNKNPLEDIVNLKTTHMVLKDGKIVFKG